MNLKHCMLLVGSKLKTGLREICCSFCTLCMSDFLFLQTRLGDIFTMHIK